MTTYTANIHRIFVDTSTLALIRTRPDINAIFAFDHHMALAGLPVLPGPLNAS